MFGFLSKIFGSANDRIVKKLLREIEQINHLEQYYCEMTDESLLKASTDLKEKVQSGAKTLDEVTYDAFALVREGAKRVLGQRHFDEQLMGGLVLHQGMICEMKTGEGKTLVATLPAYLNALTGKGVHIVTVNDYLAQRDSGWMGPLFNFLGLSVATVTGQTGDEERIQSYKADITYATNNELGFDYLRDNMKFGTDARVQRQFHYAIIDEVDSILIDEARTPLIISGPTSDRSNLYITINNLVKKLDKEDYEIEEKTKSVNLNDQGMSKIEEMLVSAKLIKDGSSLYDFEYTHLVHFINQSLKAHTMFHDNVDYMVKDGQLMIIDEFTGRVLEGRRYSEGLHQALEAKENLTIQNENQTLASITFQNYFRMYPKISGMTGTAMTEANEFKFIYNLDVVGIPPHKPIKRVDHDDEIYGSKEEKYDAILKAIKEAHEKGQPILVGTVSIEKSEVISTLFNKHKIKHKVLNAKYHEQEAGIISQAGRFGAVTIATNMAGRGTDIMLGGNLKMLLKDPSNTLSKEQLEKQVEEEKEKVMQAGGLFVIGTERHESRRIDNQLRGRSGRQGDPGRTKFFLSLEDDLMRIFASERVTQILKRFGLKGGEALHDPMITRALEKAQQRVEAGNYEVRKNLLKFDDIMNDQRKIIYAKRNDIISAQNIIQTLFDSAEDWLSSVINTFIPQSKFRDDWDLEGLAAEIERVLDVKIDTQKITKDQMIEDDIHQYALSLAKELFLGKQKDFGEMFNDVLKYIILNLIDQSWKEHLYNLDHLRQGIGLRAYGQKDPFQEYKKESFSLFEQMLDHFAVNILQVISHLHPNPNADIQKVKSAKEDLHNLSQTRVDPALQKDSSSAVRLQPSTNVYVDPDKRDSKDPNTWGRVARNELCPCGSGKKYKQCHGAVMSQ